MLLALCAGNSPVTGEFPAQSASNDWSFFIYSVIWDTQAMVSFVTLTLIWTATQP